MEKWIELVKDRPYLVLVSVAALVATAVVVGLGKPATATAVLVLWGGCFLILLVAGLAVNALFTHGRDQSLAYLGMDAIYVDRHQYDQMRPELFEKAKEIRLHSIYANLEEGGLDGLVEKALRERKTVEILIADPSSEHVQGNRPLQLAVMDSDTPKKIRRDLDILRNIERQRQKQKWLGELEVKIYRQQPMWSVYIFGDELFAAPYLYRVEGSDTLCIHARHKGSGRSAYNQFKQHYRKLWQSAVKVHLGEEVV